jgi:hypothetical protein
MMGAKPRNVHTSEAKVDVGIEGQQLAGHLRGLAEAVHVDLPLGRHVLFQESQCVLLVVAMLIVGKVRSVQDEELCKVPLQRHASG